jgi:hypothetical protein
MMNPFAVKRRRADYSGQHPGGNEDWIKGAIIATNLSSRLN